MRGKIIATGIALFALAIGWSNGAAQAEPLKIRGAWVAPLAAPETADNDAPRELTCAGTPVEVPPN